MSTQENNSRPKRAAGTPLIRETSVQIGTPPVNRLLFIPAALLSAVVNGGLLFGLMLLPNPNQASAKAQMEKAEPTETVVQADPVPEPEASRDSLLNDEVDPAAAEPDAAINYNNDRKEEVSVPGVVNPDEPVGMVNGSKDVAPVNTPAPPGIGIGQGGALEGALPGTGGPAVGMAGGYGLRGMPLAGTFYGRSGATRVKALREGGGTKETEAAVARGLKWIARQQIQDGARKGCWPLDGGRFKDRGSSNDTAGTAFGLLPLLGAGFTHKKAKNSKENPFDKPIFYGLMFLIHKQDKKTGNLGGGMYAHSLATIALCEAYGLSQDPMLRRPAQMAVDYLIKAQHSAGGWRYSPGEKGDTSVTGWVVMALKSAQMGGLTVPESKMRLAVNYVNSCCNEGNQGYGYTGNTDISPTMSAVGLLCRQYLQNWGSQNLRMIKGVENHLEKAMPSKGYKNIYYYYYATQVLHHFGGKEWQRWNEKMSKLLLETQEMTSNGGNDLTGSWSSTGQHHAASGGRLMVTSLSLLTLEVYYRHLPLYYRDMGEKRAASN